MIAQKENHNTFRNFAMNPTFNMIMLTSTILLLQLLIIESEKIDEPTLKPVDPFSAIQDKGILKKELKQDFITDRDKVANLWFRRSYEQRAQIANSYNNNFCHGDYRSYRCPLLSGLKDISDANLCDLYTDSLLAPRQLLGKTVYKAIIGKLKEVGAIEEIVCGNDAEMKNEINKFYSETYNKTVENHLGTFRKDDQDYQQVMKNYCWKGLCQDKKIKPEDADKEAKALKAIDPEKDKDGFKNKLIELLKNNCEPDLKMIFEKYRTNKDCGIGEAVDKAFECKRVKRAYNRLVRYIEDTCRFYADELHQAVDGWGTDTDKINRIILTRCERDLGCILKKYTEFHGNLFTKRLIEDTVMEGRYRLGIRLLCGEND